MERGHTFLMSSSPFKGRHSLTRLVALFNNAKIFHAKPSSDQEQKLTMKEQLRRFVMKNCLCWFIAYSQFCDLLNIEVLRFFPNADADSRLKAT